MVKRMDESEKCMVVSSGYVSFNYINCFHQSLTKRGKNLCPNWRKRVQHAGSIRFSLNIYVYVLQPLKRMSTINIYSTRYMCRIKRNRKKKHTKSP